jgi:hypothetical protein
VSTPAAGAVDVAGARVEVNPVDKAVPLLRHDREHARSKTGDLGVATGPAQASLRRAIVAQHERVEVAEAVYLRGG